MTKRTIKPAAGASRVSLREATSAARVVYRDGTTGRFVIVEHGLDGRIRKRDSAPASIKKTFRERKDSVASLSGSLRGSAKKK